MRRKLTFEVTDPFVRKRGFSSAHSATSAFQLPFQVEKFSSQQSKHRRQGRLLPRYQPHPRYSPSRTAGLGDNACHASANESSS